MLVLGATALAMAAFAAQPELATMAWALAAAVPFILMREFARRFAFAHFKMVQVLMVDVTVAALTVVVLGSLAWTGRLSAVTAIATVGLSCGTGTVGWLYLVRAEFAFRLGQVLDQAKDGGAAAGQDAAQLLIR